MFVGGLAVGAPGTIPFGMTSPVNPPGSCPANPGGPIADGSQLTDITTVPIASGSSGPAADPASSSSTAAGPSSTSTTPADSDSSSTTPADPDSDSCPAATATQSPDVTPSTTSPSMQTSDGATAASLAASTNAPVAGGLSKADLLANGQAAQKLNAQFATLTAGSSCNGMYLCSSTNTIRHLTPLFSYTAGENACVNGQFAQCVGGKFVLSPCASTLQCYALPLLLKTGTSVTCDTEADAETRIANSGATGGITGS